MVCCFIFQGTFKIGFVNHLSSLDLRTTESSEMKNNACNIPSLCDRFLL